MSVKEGDPVPSFELPTDDGGRVGSASLLGRPYVIYFYPKDDTPGCTKEAISFSCLKPEFDKLGVTVIGVSKDDIESHSKFRKTRSFDSPRVRRRGQNHRGIRCLGREIHVR